MRIFHPLSHGNFTDFVLLHSDPFHVHYVIYSKGFNYPKMTDQSIKTDGHNIDKSLCKGFNDQGYERGISFSIVDNLDYNNAFVGHYEAGGKYPDFACI